MGLTYASGVRAAWLQGVQAPPREGLPKITLQMLLDDIALDPGSIRSAVLRPLSVGGGASSSSAPPAPAAGPAVDHWNETDTHWICMHLVPRHSMFYPLDCLEGPPAEALEDIRVTHLVWNAK